jgi:hypothetical protein
MNASSTAGNPSDLAEAAIARLLSHHWCILDEEERRVALLCAELFGVDFATEAHADGEKEACGDGEDYVRVCIKWAYEECRALNDIERELWLSQGDDPRVRAFGQGFEKQMRRLTRKAR